MEYTEGDFTVHPVHDKKKILLYASPVLAIILIALGVFACKAGLFNVIDNSEVVTEDTAVAETITSDALLGSLYFSGVPFDAAHGPIGLANTFEYQPASGVLGTLTRMGINFSLAFGEEDTFFVSRDEALSGADNMRLKRMSSEGSEFLDAQSGWLEGSISVAHDDTMLAYMHMPEQPATGGDLARIENWEVVVLNSKNDETKVILDDAVYPQWIADTAVFMYMKADGLYVYDVEAHTSKKVFAAPTDFTTETNYAVSTDGTKLVMSHAGDAGVTMYELGTGFVPSPVLDTVATIGVLYMTPVFAPDGAHYAVVGLDTVAGVRTVEFRSAENHDLVGQYNLEGFAADPVILNTWVK